MYIPAEASYGYGALTRGLIGLPHDPLTGLEQFLYEYLGGRDYRVPFGGRHAQVKELDAWLANDLQKPYMLLVSGAGAGKSALVARWSYEVATSGRAEVALLPISIRFGTALKAASFAMLGARIRYLYDIDAAPPRDPTEWLIDVTTILREDRPPDKPPFLIVIDGADEATDWSLGQDLQFTPFPGQKIKLLVTARSVADCDAAGWLGKLSLRGAALLSPLPCLELRDIHEALSSIHHTDAELLDDPTTVSQLHRLTDGDPLLLRLYLDALMCTNHRPPVFSPHDLQFLEPGLDAYFNRWWNDQVSQWAPSAMVREPAVLCVRAMLACSLGPLSEDDMLDLGRSEHLTKAVLQEVALPALARFIVGDRKQGYAFSHPKLNEYFRDNKLELDERKAWEQRFIGFGWTTLDQLNTGQLPPQKASRYAVLHFGAHLDRAKADVDELGRLISRGWLLAWEANEGNHFGFLADVRRVSLAAQAKNTLMISQHKRADHLGMEIRAGLCFTSVNSLAAGISPGLITLLIETKIWTVAQALAYAAHASDTPAAARLLTALASYLSAPDIEHALQLLPKAIPQHSFYDVSDIIDAQCALLSQLPEPRRRELLPAYLEIEDSIRKKQPYWNLLALLCELGEIRDCLTRANAVQKEIDLPVDRARFWETLAGHNQNPTRRSFLNKARDTALLIVKPAIRAWFLERLSHSASSPSQRADLLENALHAYKEIPDKDDEDDYENSEDDYENSEIKLRLAHLLATSGEIEEALATIRAYQVGGDGRLTKALALASIVEHLPTSFKSELIKEAIDTCLDLNSEPEVNTISTLVDLSEYFGDHGESLLKYARDWIACIDDDSTYISAVPLAARILKGDTKRIFAQKALAVALRINDGGDRSIALADLAGHSVAQERDRMYAAAIDYAMSVRSSDERAEALTKLITLIPPSKRPPIVDAALKLVIQIDSYRNKELATQLAPYVSLASKLPRAELMRALSTTPGRHEAEALAMLTAPHVASLQQHELLAAICENTYEFGRACTLEWFARFMSDSVLEEAVKVANAITNSHNRAIAMMGIAPRFAELGRIDAALKLARSMGDHQFFRPVALARLIRFLPEECKMEGLEEALQSVRDMSEDYYKPVALEYLAPMVPESLFEEALRIVSDIKSEDNSDRSADALRALIPHLPEQLIARAWDLVHEVDVQSDWSFDNLVSSLVERQVRVGYTDEAIRLVSRSEDLEETFQNGREAVLLGITKGLVAIGRGQEASHHAKSISDDNKRTEALGCVARYLDEGDLVKAVQLVLQRPGGATLERLVPFVPELCRLDLIKLHRIWGEIHSALARSTRPEFLAGICFVALMLEKLAGTAVFHDIANSIEDAGAWWP